MLSRRYFIRAGFAAIAAGGLAACGNGSASSAAKSTKLTVAASPSPHAEILDNFAAPRLKQQGITLKTKEYTDYIIPNQVTSSGEVDANYFQHINYLNNYNKENGTDLVGVAAIHYEPFGIYAGKSKDLKGIQDGAQIAVPNDPTNEGRALLLLQQEKLITLKDPGQPAGHARRHRQEPTQPQVRRGRGGRRRAPASGRGLRGHQRQLRHRGRHAREGRPCGRG